MPFPFIIRYRNKIVKKAPEVFQTIKIVLTLSYWRRRRRRPRQHGDESKRAGKRVAAAPETRRPRGFRRHLRTVGRVCLQLHLQDAVQQVAGRGHHSGTFPAAVGIPCTDRRGAHFPTLGLHRGPQSGLPRGTPHAAQFGVYRRRAAGGPAEGGGKTRPTTW